VRLDLVVEFYPVAVPGIGGYERNEIVDASYDLG
jgi:hypothetical protein